MISPASSSAVLVMDTFRRPSLLTKLPKFTREQVLANDHRNWIIVGGLVFDLTDFVKIHPGGDEVLLEFMGMDVTSVFEDMHNAHAKLVLLKYVIGRVVEVKAGPTAMQQHNEQRRNSRIRSSTESLHSISSIESLEERSP